LAFTQVRKKILPDKRDVEEDCIAAELEEGTVDSYYCVNGAVVYSCFSLSRHINISIFGAVADEVALLNCEPMENNPCETWDQSFVCLWSRIMLASGSRQLIRDYR
jgi:hypothetical protein